MGTKTNIKSQYGQIKRKWTYFFSIHLIIAFLILEIVILITIVVISIIFKLKFDPVLFNDEVFKFSLTIISLTWGYLLIGVIIEKWKNDRITYNIKDIIYTRIKTICDLNWMIGKDINSDIGDSSELEEYFSRVNEFNARIKDSLSEIEKYFGNEIVIQDESMKNFIKTFNLLTENYKKQERLYNKEKDPRSNEYKNSNTLTGRLAVKCREILERGR